MQQANLIFCGAICKEVRTNSLTAELYVGYFFKHPITQCVWKIDPLPYDFFLCNVWQVVNDSPCEYGMVK